MTNRPSATLRYAAIGIILFILGALLPWLTKFFIADTRRTVNETALNLRIFWKQELVGFAVLGLAYLLYRLKKQYLAWYGGLEIAVAYLGAFHATTKSLSLILTGSITTLDTDADRMLALLTLLGSVYLGVQGFENLKAGLKQGEAKAAGGARDRTR